MKRRIFFVCLAAILAAPSYAQTEDRIAQYEQRITNQQEQLDQMRQELDELKAIVGRQEAPPVQTAANSDPDETPPGPFVKRKNENLDLQFSGRLHRMVNLPRLSRRKLVLVTRVKSGGE